MALRPSPPARDMLEICLHYSSLASSYLCLLLLKQLFSFTCENRGDLDKGNQMQLHRRKFKEELVGIPGCSLHLSEGGDPSMSSTLNSIKLEPWGGSEHT